MQETVYSPSAARLFYQYWAPKLRKGWQLPFNALRKVNEEQNKVKSNPFLSPSVKNSLSRGEDGSIYEK